MLMNLLQYPLVWQCVILNGKLKTQFREGKSLNVFTTEKCNGFVPRASNFVMNNSNLSEWFSQVEHLSKGENHLHMTKESPFIVCRGKNHSTHLYILNHRNCEISEKKNALLILPVCVSRVRELIDFNVRLLYITNTPLFTFSKVAESILIKNKAHSLMVAQTDWSGHICHVFCENNLKECVISLKQC